VNILDELIASNREARFIPNSETARAMRRMKRDRLTIRKMQERLRWYDAKVTALQNELRRRAALQSSAGDRTNG
jgi:hypothetical protein